MTQYRKQHILCCLPILLALFYRRGNLFCQDNLDYEIVLQNTRIDDAIIDRRSRIITCDNAMGLIQVFDRDGKHIKDIQLPSEQSDRYYSEYSSRKLAVDTNGNIYCLTLSMESFFSLSKFDTSGNLIKRFFADNKMPPRDERIVDFYVSSSNKIYFNTFPHGRTQAEKDPVYVFDFEGNSLGRVDYYIEDHEGKVCKFNTSQLHMAKYQQTAVKPSRELPRIVEKNIGGNVFVGFDRENNLYVASENVTRKLNVSLQVVREFQTPLKALDTYEINCNHRNIRVGYDGTIFLFGHRRDSGRENGVNKGKIMSVLVRLGSKKN